MSGGGAFTIYSGSRRQRGGGFLGSLRRSLAPIGRQAFRGIKTIAKKVAANKTVRQVAKKAAQQGAEILGNVAVDALTGRDVGQSIKQHTQQAALRAIVGDNVPPPPPRQSSSNKLKQRKRLAPVSNTFTARKRRRINNLSRASLNRQDLF